MAPGIRLLLPAIAVMLFLVVAAFAVAATVRAGNHQGPGQIAVFKTVCESIGQQDTCNGRDTSLDDHLVDFDIYAGTGTEGQLVETVSVTLGENAGGGGNVGDGSQGRIVSGELAPGTYTVCEIPVAYLLEGDQVIHTVDLDAIPRPEPGNGGSTGGQQTQFGDDCVVVEVTASGTAEVKFLDLALAPPPEVGSITIIKDAQPDSAQDFVFTTTGQGLTGFTLDDDADATLPNQQVFSDLAAGMTYTVTETAPTSPWVLSNIVCTGGGTTVDVATRTVSIALAADANVVCTFINTQQVVQAQLGSITIVKDAQPNAPQDFAFTTTGTGLVNFTLDDDADPALSNQRVFADLSAGTYTVTEAALGGWRLANLTCSAGGAVNLGQATATITLAAGANVTCTFTNVPTGGQQGGGGGPTAQPPRQGTLGGNVPNTAMAVDGVSPTPATLAGVLLLVAGLRLATATARAEVVRRR